jgi:hypothetical protein
MAAGEDITVLCRRLEGRHVILRLMLIGNGSFSLTFLFILRLGIHSFTYLTNLFNTCYVLDTMKRGIKFDIK